MKLSQLSIRLFLSITWIVVATESVFSQSGNMSDITLPSPDALVTEPPTGSGNEGSDQTPTEGDVDVVEGQTPTEGDVDVVEGQTPT
ncbi:MAG: hypothetical protein AAGF83_27640, partial [Cyanobacteria bacterium P01_G01_bin.67]